MESRYEEEKMACVYNIMEKNKLRKETEDLLTQLKKLETTKERLEENEVLKTRIQKMETYICHLQLQNEEFKAQHEVMKMQCDETTLDPSFWSIKDCNGNQTGQDILVHKSAFLKASSVNRYKEREIIRKKNKKSNLYFHI